jgi:hypothetical protein
MRAFLAMIVGGLGLGALLRRRRQNSQAEIGADPADELRARLAESKSVTSAENMQADGRADIEETSGATPDPGARREDVHQRAREAIEKLR